MMGINAKILVIDDEEDLRENLKYILKMKGYEVALAEDGVQGLKKLESYVPDLIILDLNMPNMGGLELIKNIKALPGYKFVPILTLTTESDASKRDEGKRLGAAGWLVKPISGADLLKVLKQLLPQP